MNTAFLLTLTLIALPVIVALFWWEFRTTGCAYGGSDHGTDNWLLVHLKASIRRQRARWAERETRDVSDI